MSIPVQDTDEHPPTSASAAAQRGETLSDARRRRAAALKRIAGLWAGRQDIPADGLEYQRELRSEWR